MTAGGVMRYQRLRITLQTLITNLKWEAWAHLLRDTDASVTDEKKRAAGHEARSRVHNSYTLISHLGY